ncbi:HlyD family type I secretion periplasmic adaptor subunit [Sphingobium sp. TA15]|uniref:Membrane fusion protein (MFP) family protein n=1 Tax=Sphingobium indicum (strain DSM 16413 / CCM 7287 / MTCC 6362 / UT26 / NBRC 101211 / UT26S) TaxID=452662 RepID=D4Z5X7_SPHIU|nr:HlyD family type I secretion periplasmic adaptor subunit [Sphingobium indicum]BAI98009.1 HlyD-family secretion protein [Sphingobium indicum UT26S]BDD67390.1 HlyD family type I secretion periplasmic adaptor subunit [Sphingobium sp. TA15]
MSSIAQHWDVVRAALADERRRARNLNRVDDVTFLPAALEIIEQPVSPTARATTRVLLIGLVLTLLWLTFGKVDVVASAPGRLIPADNVKLVQPAEAGIVRAIHVRNGQFVRKGQVLVELDPTVSAAETIQAEAALQTALFDIGRARGVLSALDGKGLNFIPPQGTAPQLVATQRALAAAELATIEASVSGRSADLQAAKAARSEALAQAAKLTETIPLLDQQLDAYEGLLTKGYAAKLKVIEMRRQRFATIRDREAALATARKAEAQSSSASSTMAQSKAEARSRILTDLAKAEADARLRQEELTKSRQRSSLQRLVAPVDGTITQLSIHTIGGVVEPAKPIMVVVPKGGSLIAEVKILNKDMGFVKDGQPVAIKLEAFPFTRYGTIPGYVESIGSDAVEDEKLGLVYPARIRLDPIDRGRTTEMRLSAGLATTADIRTGRRSILSYLVSPIDEATQEAARER